MTMWRAFLNQTIPQFDFRTQNPLTGLRLGLSNIDNQVNNYPEADLYSANSARRRKKSSRIRTKSSNSVSNENVIKILPPIWRQNQVQSQQQPPNLIVIKPKLCPQLGNCGQSSAATPTSTSSPTSATITGKKPRKKWHFVPPPVTRDRIIIPPVTATFTSTTSTSSPTFDVNFEVGVEKREADFEQFSNDEYMTTPLPVPDYLK